jgi:hypothetical protein
MDVVPISPDVAKYARGTKRSEMDVVHAAMMGRAKRNKDDSIPDLLGAKDVPAKYKIEVKFQPDRTVQGPNTCVIEFWESGSKDHGGGDELMFICRNHLDFRQGCGAIFSQSFVRDGLAICPKCNKALNASLLTNKLKRDDRNRLTTKELCAHLAKFWLKLGGNADIYLKFHPADTAPKPTHISQSGTLRKNREYEKALYPLKRIITDTSAGAALETCIYNFMTA